MMKSWTSHSPAVVAPLSTALCMLAMLVGTAQTFGQTFNFDVVDDTTMLTNGGSTGDTEDNFGGRTELIGSLNGGNFRDMLFRFDVSAAAAEINNPGLTVTEAQLRLNPRDERSGIQPSSGILDVFGLVSGNNGWVEGTKTGSSGGPTGQFGAVSARFLSTPSSQSTSAIPDLTLPDPTVDDDGTRWFSQGGGSTQNPLEAASLFDVAVDTTNEVLGTGTLTAGWFSSDDDLVIQLNGPALNGLLSDWLAAPLMSDQDGGMQTSNAGLIVKSPEATAAQAFFESFEGRPEEAARLSLTFGAPPVDGDVDGDTDVDEIDYNTILGNFGQNLADRTDGDLVNNDLIDLADFLQWKTNFPSPISALGTAVPEPTSALLLLSAVASAGMIRRR